jgi:glucose-1-phosphate thymidylyltransferase
MMSGMSSLNRCEVVGLIPAGGRADRISPLPCSKELYPVSLRLAEDGSARPKVVSHYLLESMRRAGAKKAFIVLREGKWDIPAYYNDGADLLDMHLAYLMMRLPYGPPFTIDQAYPFVRDATVAFGFPDILFEPVDAFAQLLERQAAMQADVVLGVWTIQPADLVDDRLVIDSDGRVRHIAVKSAQSDLRLTWVVAVWGPAFTEFMHAYLANVLHTNGQLAGYVGSVPREIIMGDVLAAAVESGLHMNTVQFPGARYLDIGTPEALASLSTSQNALAGWLGNMPLHLAKNSGSGDPP